MQIIFASGASAPLPIDGTWTWCGQSAKTTTRGARTIGDIERLPKSSKSRFNCSRAPLFPIIGIDHIVPDTLHLFLRVLINLLILDLRRADGIDKMSSVKLDRTKQTHIAAYEKFPNEKCKISFRWYVSEDTKKLQWRDLTGPEKRVLFKEMDVPTTFPNLSRAKDIQDIWKTATELFNKLSLDNLSSTQINQFQLDVKAWVKAFLKVYHTNHITPYIHCFAMHVPEIMHMYGNLSTLSQQGLEKLNNITTAHFFRSTNTHKHSSS